MCLTQNPDAIPAEPFLKYPKVSILGGGGGQRSKFWVGQNIPWPTHSNFWGAMAPLAPPVPPPLPVERYNIAILMTILFTQSNFTQ